MFWPSIRSLPVPEISNDPDNAVRARLLQFAKNAGAQDADVIAVRAQNLDVSVRKGVVEDASRAESFGIGLRIFKGHKSAYGSSADASDEGLRRLAQQVADMADAVPEDKYARLATAAESATAWPDLDLCDDAAPLDVKALAAMAKQAEDAALTQKGVTNSDGASAGQGVHWLGITSSNGFDGAYAHSSSFLSLSVIGGKGDAMETDHASTSATYAADLEAPDAVGLRAAARTVARLNPRTGKTGSFPIIFDRRVSASLLRTLSRVVSGPRLAKGTSFISGKLGEKIFSDSVTVIDDPLKLRGLRSGPFDAEGLPVMRRAIVEAGILKSLFLDLRSAARLDLPPTGHATRGLSSPPGPAPSNLWIEAGAQSLEDMVAAIGDGFLVTDLMGASISLSTGDYSRGASGFWVEGGKIAYPVSEMTIAGNLKDMFLRITPASDLEFRDGIDAPSLLIEGMVTASR